MNDKAKMDLNVFVLVMERILSSFIDNFKSELSAVLFVLIDTMTQSRNNIRNNDLRKNQLQLQQLIKADNILRHTR
jgi:hypothetical protein